MEEGRPGNAPLTEAFLGEHLRLSKVWLMATEVVVTGVEEWARCSSESMSNTDSVISMVVSDSVL